MLNVTAGRQPRFISWVFAAFAAVITPALVSTAEAKTPGKTYCFNGTCHRVNTIAEMAALVGKDESFSTSFYDDCKRDRYNPCGLTSSGEVFHADTPDNAASPIYPDGTILLVFNPANGKAATVRVNNAGPYHGKRKLDVSRATAEALGFKKRGVADLQVRVVSAPAESEARYKKHRQYAPVPGSLGHFASLDAAQGGMTVAMALDAMSGSLYAPASAKLLKSGKIKLAAADLIVPDAAEPAKEESPADGLRAAARRTYGKDMGIRRIAPSTLTAEVLHQYITQRM